MAGDATATRLRTNCGLPAPRAGRPVPAPDARRSAPYPPYHAAPGPAAAVDTAAIAESPDLVESMESPDLGDTPEAAESAGPETCTGPGGPASMRTWLYRIATDEVRAAVEKARRTTADAASAGGAGIPAEPSAPFDGRPEVRPQPVG